MPGVSWLNIANDAVRWNILLVGGTLLFRQVSKPDKSVGPTIQIFVFRVLSRLSRGAFFRVFRVFRWLLFTPFLMFPARDVQYLPQRI